MKNQKTFKTVLNTIAFITVLMSLLMLLIHIIGSSWNIFDQFSYFYSLTGDLATGTITINWNFAGIFLTFILISLFTWGLEFGFYTIPNFKKGEPLAGVKLFCKILIGLGLIVAMIGLLLPNGRSQMEILPETTDSWWKISNVLSWIGLPLSFGATLAHVGVEFAR